MKSVAEKLNRISKSNSQWIKDAEYRQRNKWWIKYWQRIQLKYFRVKRVIFNLL